MSVHLGMRRRRSYSVELNLVPFVDFLSCLVAFLLMTAVWAELSAMEYDPFWRGCGPVPVDVPPLPNLTVHLTKDGYHIYRYIDRKGLLLPTLAEDPLLRSLDRLLAVERDFAPEEIEFVLVSDDGVTFGETMAVLDHFRDHGYSYPYLAGGPPSSSSSLSQLPRYVVQ